MPPLSWSMERGGTHRRAGGQDSDGASAQAPLRSRTLVRCVHHRTSHTRPTDHLQDTSYEGRPIPRSDRVNETLAADYQDQQRGTCILTADTGSVGVACLRRSALLTAGSLRQGSHTIPASALLSTGW